MTYILIQNDGEYVVLLSGMNPGDVGIIIDSPGTKDVGCVVMRTLSEDKFEVMNLSRFVTNSCWVRPVDYINISIYPAAKIILKLVQGGEI